MMCKLHGVENLLFDDKQNYQVENDFLNILSNRGLFPLVYMASSKHEETLENSRQLCKPSTTSRVCITIEISSNSLSV